MKAVPQFELGPFMQEFPVVKGIQQFYLEDSMEKEEEARKDSVTGYAGRDENLIKQLRCSHSWPVCIFDFTVTKTIHEFFVFKLNVADNSPSIEPIKESTGSD